MGTALTLILVACAAFIVWAFITGRVSAAKRRTYLPRAPEVKVAPDVPDPGKGESPGQSAPGADPGTAPDTEPPGR